MDVVHVCKKEMVCVACTERNNFPQIYVMNVGRYMISGNRSCSWINCDVMFAEDETRTSMKESAWIRRDDIMKIIKSTSASLNPLRIC